ncbi:hypothetical protein MHBO_004480 [Bonamia ostreae]|uniref:Uncharacterized protein n=1 Tax=Bonamia ostreae TaxID=126728 RepID=A0ABV2ATX6_9EUKA
MLGELCSEYTYWSARQELTEDGYFYSTRENIEEKTGLSSYQQREALKKLTESGIIETQKRGTPCKTFYCINESNLAIMLYDKKLKNLTSSSQKISHQEVEKFNANNNITNNSNNNSNKKESVNKTRFTPPSVSEVTDYCKERNNGIDANRFVDYYEARGWELGKGRKMKSWKACVRTWEQNGKENNGKPKRDVEDDARFRNLPAVKRFTDLQKGCD